MHPFHFLAEASEIVDGRELAARAFRVGTATASTFGLRSVAVLGGQVVILGATAELGPTIWLGSVPGADRP